MRVLIYSYFPPLAHRLLGGAQRFLDGLLTAFTDTPVEVTVAHPSTTSADLRQDAPGLKIAGGLEAVDAPRTATQYIRDQHTLDEHCQWADLVVTIDRHFPLSTNKPILLCLNNFSYGPETQSVVGRNWDAVVVPSDFLRRSLEKHFAQTEGTLPVQPIHVVPCGVNAQIPTPADVQRVRHRLALDEHDKYIAFPHRPDPDKGFDTAAQAIALLKDAGMRYTMLVPTPDETEIWPNQREHLKQRRELVKELGIRDFVRFHPWIEAHETPAYLGVADWSVTLSRLPEGFGLSVLESLGARVPVIATPAGAIVETTPPDHGVTRVGFGDAIAAAKTIAEGVAPHSVAKGQAYVKSTFNWNVIAQRWIKILNATIRSRPNLE